MSPVSYNTNLSVKTFLPMQYQKDYGMDNQLLLKTESLYRVKFILDTVNLVKAVKAIETLLMLIF